MVVSVRDEEIAGDIYGNGTGEAQGNWRGSRWTAIVEYVGSGSIARGRRDDASTG